MTGIYNTFGTHEFTRRKLEEIFHVTDARHTIDPLLSLNLIIERQSKRNLYYRLAVTPDDRPECFEASTGNPSHEQKMAIIETSPNSQVSAHQTRLAKKREAYATQPPEKLEARRAQMRARAHARRAAETPEEREKRLSNEQERRRKIKETETPEEHEIKLATRRAAYAAKSPEKLEARRSQM